MFVIATLYFQISNIFKVILLKKSVTYLSNYLICLGFYFPLENFSLIWRSHHYRRRATNPDIYSKFMAIEEWGFFNVPCLLWHGPALYDGHLRGPMTLKPVAELSQPVLRTYRSILTGDRPYYVITILRKFNIPAIGCKH